MILNVKVLLITCVFQLFLLFACVHIYKGAKEKKRVKKCYKMFVVIIIISTLDKAKGLSPILTKL